MTLIQFKIISNRASYEITLHHKVTVIRGNSGKGKSWMHYLIKNHNKGVKGVEIQGELPVKAVNNEFYEQDFSRIKEKSILVIDEDCLIFKSDIYGNKNEKIDKLKEFMEKSEHYFILITRTNLARIPLSVGAICEFEIRDDITVNKIVVDKKHKIWC